MCEVESKWFHYITYTKYISLLEQNDCTPPNVANCQNALRWRTFVQDKWMSQIYVGLTDAGTTQDKFILPAPHVEGLPISQDWLDTIIIITNVVVVAVTDAHNTIYILCVIMSDMIKKNPFNVSVGGGGGAIIRGRRPPTSDNGTLGKLLIYVANLRESGPLPPNP